MRPAQTKRKRFARSSHRTLSQSGQWQHLDVWWQSGSLPSEIRAETQCKSLSSGSVQAFKVFSIQLISRNFTKIRPQFSWFRRLGPTSKVTSDGGAKKEVPLLCSSPRNVQHEQTKPKGKDWGRSSRRCSKEVHDSHVRFIRRLQRLSVQINFNILDVTKGCYSNGADRQGDGTDRCA